MTVRTTRYDECLKRVVAYTQSLRCNASAVDGLVRSFVTQPAYDVIFRAQLIEKVLGLLSKADVTAKERASALGCSFCHNHSVHMRWCPNALSLQWRTGE